MSAMLGEGIVFAGRYRVVRCIARGGMGAVYEAVHTETGRRRALKVMHPHLFQSDEMRERFQREARLAAHVESEYIVDVSDAGIDEATGMPFLIMELLAGEELGVRVKRAGPMPPNEVLVVLQQVAWALDRTHAASIVHRDLKPENLFLTRREDGSPRVKILDFGVAKLVAEGATGATAALGTPLYMAPEQFYTHTKLGPAADIYALGMMAYTLLVGAPYWADDARGVAVMAFAMVAVRGPVQPATQRAAARGVTLPPAFDPWFARVTALNPADRFPSASEAVRALAEALGGAVLAVTPIATPSPQESASSATLSGAATQVWPGSASGKSGGSGSASQPLGSGPQPLVVGSTGAVPAPSRSRGPVIALVAALGLAVLGVGASWGLRTTPGGPPSSSEPAVPAKAEPSVPAPVPVPDPDPEPLPAAAPPSATATASAAPAPPKVPKKSTPPPLAKPPPPKPASSPFGRF